MAVQDDQLARLVGQLVDLVGKMGSYNEILDYVKVIANAVLSFGGSTDTGNMIRVSLAHIGLPDARLADSWTASVPVTLRNVAVHSSKMANSLPVRTYSAG